MYCNEMNSNDNSRSAPLLSSSEASSAERSSSLLESSGTTSRPTRRGNSLILVTAILVLLVIVASAYITRIQGSRITGAATESSSKREGIADKIGQDLAQEIAEHLFVRPTDGGAIDSNVPRLAIPGNAPPFAPAESDLSLAPPMRHNVPPFEVKAWTNWPDPGLTPIPPAQNPMLYPLSTFTSQGQDLESSLGIGEANPLGEPGFGDTRWLADNEPIRVTLPGADGSFGTPAADDFQIFSQWRHPSYIPRPNNGWRLCYDISNVEAGLLMDLSIPVEQFLAIRPGGAGGDAAVHGTTGLPRMPDDFIPRVSSWFNDYANSYTDPTMILPNFLRLSDLDGDGDKFDDPRGDLPSDEFVPGSARFRVGTVLCDTDGDGFTDSFWFLAPTSIDRSIRTVVGVRIVDNGGLAPINVAGRFMPIDGGLFAQDVRTKGTTPADLAYVGQLDPPPAGFPQIGDLDNYNVGFGDFHAHSSVIVGGGAGSTPVNYFAGIQGSPQTYWQRHVQQIGMPHNGFFFPSQDDRLIWWRNVGVEGPLTPTIQFGFAPYSLADELELRMYHGNNNAWSLSRLEHSLAESIITENSFLRSGIQYEETSEFLADQRSNRGLVIDKRRMMTTYSATRNDLLPPWLWPHYNLNTLTAFDRQKVDLRAPEGDYNRDGNLNQQDLVYLRDVIHRALISEETQESYAGPITTGNDNLDRAERVASMFAANIAAYSDEDSEAPLRDKILILDGTSNGVTGEFHAYGLEKQPFLVEAMVGHVYAADHEAASPHPDAGNGGPIVPGDDIVCRNSPNTTFVVVQIANPFPTAIPFSNPDSNEHFEIDIFGQTIDLRNLSVASPSNNPIMALPSASYDTPTTLTIVAMEDELDNDDFKDPWIRFLGLAEPNAPIIFVDVDEFPALSLSTTRTHYDAGMSATGMVSPRDDVIQIVRVAPDPQSGGQARVIIDRFDDPADFGDNLGPDVFGEETGDLETRQPGGNCDNEPPAGAPWARVKNVSGMNPQATHWMHWTHVTRAWGVRPELDDRAHRFVFANHEVTTDSNAFFYDLNGDVAGIDPDEPDEWRAMFDHGEYETLGFPDKGFDGTQASSTLGFPFQMLWKDGDIEQLGELMNIFTHSHLLLYGSGGGGYQRTLQTFSEFLQQELRSTPGPNKYRVGRLDPFRTNTIITGEEPSGGFVLPAGQTFPPPRPPALPAALRVLEAFVCDGPGHDITPPDDAYRLAHGFTGWPVHGLLNINTAFPEVLRMLPHMARLIHGGGLQQAEGGFSVQPRVAVPEAIVQARELSNGGTNPPNRTGYPNGPDYKDRGKFGFDGIGELLLLDQDAQGDIIESNGILVEQDAWNINFAGMAPFAPEPPGPDPVQSAFVSTDVVQPSIDIGNDAERREGDQVAADLEEHNLLFNGLSSLVTTRSDTFTVYFRVRSFRQNPTTGVWNAMDPEHIVDDSRYVMLVDRSNVNSPSDKPRILYLEKLPN